MQLDAQSATVYARTWLRTARRVRVLHIFEHACNLVAAGDSVLSLVTPDVGDGPFNVVVPAVDFRQHVRQSDPVRAEGDRLRIGALAITLATAAAWNPCPDWPRLRAQRDHLRRQDAVIRDALRRDAPADSLAQLVVTLPPPSSDIEVKVVSAAREQWEAMVRGLRKLDRDVCWSGAAGLAGLGGGLTPAGDDWLLGCALAAQVVRGASPAAELMLEAVDSAAAGTHVLSASWLRAAVRGECAEPWHAFFAQGLDSDPYGTHRAARWILRQGHSSGADALAGYLAALRVLVP